MTEAAWLTGDELWRMMRHAVDSGAMTARKQFLYSVAVCRQRGAAMPPPYLPLLNVLEAIADPPELPPDPESEMFLPTQSEPPRPFPPPLDQLLNLQLSARRVFAERAGAILRAGETYDEGDSRFDADDAVLYATMMNPFAASYGNGQGSIHHSPAEAAILRCVVGNPFRSVAFDPRWRSDTAIALATDMYEGRAFDHLPILADELEEAGCDHPDVLAHCRASGSHVRGCWVVDLVLGR